jgi:hypothetical protein
MGMIPATAFVLITLIATAGAVEIGISVITPSSQLAPVMTGAPGNQQGAGNGENSSQPSLVAVQATIPVGSSINTSSPGFRST